MQPIAAEWLIGSAQAGSPAGSDPLTDLLAAAASPPRRGELAGEQAAVMAFRDARQPTMPQSRRRSMLKTALAKAATAKAAVVVAALAGGGGVAFAAGGGHLPGGAAERHPAGGAPASATASAHARTPDAERHSVGSGRHGAPIPQPSPTHPAAKPSSATPDASPSPDLRGLCTAFRAGVGDNPGKALDNPAFTVLIKTAGGKDNVASYCATLLSTRPGRPPIHPGNPSHHPHGTRPTQAPPTHPSGPQHRPGPGGPPREHGG